MHFPVFTLKSFISSYVINLLHKEIDERLYHCNLQFHKLQQNLLSNSQLRNCASIYKSTFQTSAVHI